MTGQLAPQQPTSLAPIPEVSTPRRTIQLQVHVSSDMPAVNSEPAELKILAGMTALVIDDIGPLSAILRTTQANLVHLTSAQMLVGHRRTLTGDIREGQFGFVAISIPPRRFVSPKAYNAAIGQVCGIIRTAVGSSSGWG